MRPDRPAARLLSVAVATVALCAVALSMAAIAQDAKVDESDSKPGVRGHVTLYTSVTQDTVDAVLDVLADTHPDLEVAVFRAPTGELDARIATELRGSGLGADVLWMTDPLSMQRYDAAALLASLSTDSFGAVPEQYRSTNFVGTRLLNLVIVAGDGVDPEPTSWKSLADTRSGGVVALPDPGFAGSAFAALGYFAGADELGIEFYDRLKTAGAVQVSSPGEVLNGVAEGRFAAGISLDKVVRAAIEKGSPIELIWPEPGAIVLYSPAAVVASSDDRDAAHAFVEFLVTPEAQSAIASTGWQPVRSDIEWPHDGPVVATDWQQLFGNQQALLDAYRAVFGD